jgi:hypothetical protein
MVVLSLAFGVWVGGSVAEVVAFVSQSFRKIFVWRGGVTRRLTALSSQMVYVNHI